jgi:hypothetical protein
MMFTLSACVVLVAVVRARLDFDEDCAGQKSGKHPTPTCPKLVLPFATKLQKIVSARISKGCEDTAPDQILAVYPFR